MVVGVCSQNMAIQKYSRLDQPLFTRFIRLGTPYVELNAQVRFSGFFTPMRPCHSRGRAVGLAGGNTGTGTVGA